MHFTAELQKDRLKNLFQPVLKTEEYATKLAGQHDMVRVLSLRSSHKVTLLCGP